jgi:hypothetical protein
MFSGIDAYFKSIQELQVRVIEGQRSLLMRVAERMTVSSWASARVAPLSAIGKRLDEVADLAIDNGGQPGAALVPVKGVR